MIDRGSGIAGEVVHEANIVAAAMAAAASDRSRHAFIEANCRALGGTVRLIKR